MEFFKRLFAGFKRIVRIALDITIAPVIEIVATRSIYFLDVIAIAARAIFVASFFFAVPAFLVTIATFYVSVMYVYRLIIGAANFAAVLTSKYDGSETWTSYDERKNAKEAVAKFVKELEESFAKLAEEAGIEQAA